METLVEIITELRQEITVLENLVDLQKEEIKKQTESMLYWYEKCTALSTPKTLENE